MLRTERKPLLIGGAVGLILGLLLGMLLFWQVWPVTRTDAHSYDLAPEGKAEYVSLLADSVKVDRDYSRPAKLLDAWTAEEKQQAFADAVKAYEQQGQLEKAQAVRDLALTLGVPEEPVSVPTTQAPGLLDRLRVPCLVFLIVLLVLVLGWIGLRFLLKQQVFTRKPSTKPAVTPVAPKAEEQPEEGPRQPLGRWVTTYREGEDAYDESFPIETSSGEYLGECGVGISEVIGAGGPGKVTAFEVWLFDKGDIRTVTKVLMSDYAYHNDALRSKLASKGEAVLAQVGVPVTLETSGLTLEVNLSDLEYGKGDPAPNSFFSGLTVELAASGGQAARDLSSA